MCNNMEKQNKIQNVGRNKNSLVVKVAKKTFYI